MLDVGADRQIVTNVMHAGSFGYTWGNIVIGRPMRLSSMKEAANIYVYEALVFDRALTQQEINLLKGLFREKYRL